MQGRPRATPHAETHRLAGVGYDILAELAGQHGPVHIREHGAQRGDNVGGGGILELFALVEEV